MNKILSLFVFACIFAFAIGSAIIPVQETSAKIAAGFEYVGAVEGKIFLMQVPPRRLIDWNTARSVCYDAGYEMGLVESAAQDETLRLYFRSINGPGFAWMDGTDFVTAGEWHSPTSGKNLTYFNWQANRPLKDIDTSCLMWKQIDIQGPGSFWDVTCKDINYALCQTRI